MLTGRMGFGTAAAVLVTAEGALFVVVLLTALGAARRHSNRPSPERWENGLAEVLPGSVAALLVGEINMLSSAYLFLRRRISLEQGNDTPISPARGRAALLLAFAAIAGLELFAADLLIPWEKLGPASWVRWAVLAFSGYGVLWILARAAAERTHPHLASADALVLRSGPWTVARVPWSAIDVLVSGRPGEEDDHRLVLDVPMSVPDLHIELHGPVPTRRAFGRPGPLHRRFSLSVHDAAAAVREIRRRIEESSSAPGRHPRGAGSGNGGNQE